MYPFFTAKPGMTGKRIKPVGKVTHALSVGETTPDGRLVSVCGKPVRIENCVLHPTCPECRDILHRENRFKWKETGILK